MTLKRCLLLCLAGLVLLSACGRRERPNVLIITIDTLRADHLACYGYDKPTSPEIDAFAASAVLFEQVLCQAPQTLPSHASIFTGLYPRTHKAISHETVVAPEFTTLAEVLSENGYATGAMVSNHVLDPRYGLDQGFATYKAVHRAYPEPRRAAMYAREEDPTTDEALAWLEDHGKSPFFLWIHWFHPHRAYDPPPRYKQMFAGSYSGPAVDQGEFAMKAWREKIDLPAEDVAYMRGLYDGEVAFTDAQVGRVLDELESSGLARNTLVIITSDHGEILYEHEHYFGHDIAVYDECTLVPLLIRLPGVEPARRRVPGLVQTIDIFPTVLEALGIAPLAQVEGKSLLPLVRGSAEATTRYGFSETFPFPEKCPPRHAVRSEAAKLIWRQEPPAEVVKEFYDLGVDPGETTNLYRGNPQIGDSPEARELDAALAAWTAPGGLVPAPIPSATESGRRKILKSLGYLD